MGNGHERFDRQGIKKGTTSSRRFPPPRSPTTSAAVLSRRLGTSEALMSYSVDRVGLYATRGRDMYLLASPRHACRSRYRAQITARKPSRKARSHHRRLAADSGALPGVVPRTEWPRVASRHPAVANRQRARGICCLKGRGRLTAAYSGLAFWYAGIRYVQ